MDKSETINVQKYTDAAERLLNMPIDFTGMSDKEIDELNTAINLAVASLKQSDMITIAWTLGAYSRKSITAEEALERIGQAYLNRKNKLTEAGSII